MSDALELWTVYDHPGDYPQSMVARKFIVDEAVIPTEHVVISPNLESLRAILKSKGLFRLVRNEGDDPKIVETWI